MSVKVACGVQVWHNLPMHVFLINLDHDTGRLEAADKQLKSQSVAYERVSAVYGKGLADETKSAAINRFRWWCAVGRKPRDGEIGCALSHYGIYRKMIAESVPSACVLEDDVALDPRFAEALATVEGVVDTSKAQVFLFSNHSSEQFVENGGNGISVKKSRGDRFADGYVLTCKAAQVLLEENYPMHTPCDYWDRWVRHGAIELFHVFPITVHQDRAAFGSSTTHPGERLVKDYPLPFFLCHKFKRLVGLTIDRILG